MSLTQGFIGNRSTRSSRRVWQYEKPSQNQP